MLVLGDNRSRSIDSRDWGPLPLDDVTGRVVVRIWPPR
ncbi:MAG: S26 family signal peptidase [Kineosporiaceae bacterium]